MKIMPVILCGGSGTRLWPESKKKLPKQFIDFGGWTLFQKTILRIKDPIFDYPLISTNVTYLNLVKRHLRKYKIRKYKIILDPHSAIGFGVLKKIKLKENNVVLATAHPSKFPEAINRSINVKHSLPNKFKYVLDEKENYDIIPYNLEKIKQYIKSKIK